VMLLCYWVGTKMNLSSKQKAAVAIAKGLGPGVTVNKQAS